MGLMKTRTCCFNLSFLNCQFDFGVFGESQSIIVTKFNKQTLTNSTRSYPGKIHPRGGRRG